MVYRPGNPHSRKDNTWAQHIKIAQAAFHPYLVSQPQASAFPSSLASGKTLYPSMPMFSLTKHYKTS